MWWFLFRNLFLITSTAVGVLFFLSWIYHRWFVGWCRCTEDMSGKVVLITGGDSGIGFETAKNLAFRNCRLILSSENEKNGFVAVSKLVSLTNNYNIVFKKLDLRSLSSVRAFASDIISCEDRLDVLINNAGIIGTRSRQDTEDGFEVTMSVNYFGPFLLTNLLLPLIIKSAPSRIINVTSLIHKRGQLDIENMNGEQKYPAVEAYPRSKLALSIFTKELARRLRQTGVTVNSVSPGMVATNIVKSMFPRFPEVVLNFPFPFVKSALEGAQTSIHLAGSKELENISGRYFADCRVAEESPLVRDPDIGEKLWQRSAYLTQSA